MGRGTEAEQAYTLSRFDPGNAQAAKANDARTEQRSRVEIVERCGQREDKVSARQCVLRIAAGNAVTSEYWRVAEIFAALATIWTRAVSTSKPGDTNARTHTQVGGCTVDDLTHDLMAGNHSRQFRR